MWESPASAICPGLQKSILVWWEQPRQGPRCDQWTLWVSRTTYCAREETLASHAATMGSALQGLSAALPSGRRPFPLRITFKGSIHLVISCSSFSVARCRGWCWDVYFTLLLKRMTGFWMSLLRFVEAERKKQVGPNQRKRGIGWGHFWGTWTCTRKDLLPCVNTAPVINSFDTIASHFDSTGLLTKSLCNPCAHNLLDICFHILMQTDTTGLFFTLFFFSFNMIPLLNGSSGDLGSLGCLLLKEKRGIQWHWWNLLWNKGSINSEGLISPGTAWV